MRDFTKDSVSVHILSTAGPIALAMCVQLIYQLVDLYFVSALGAAAIAGVNAAGNVVLLVHALTQALTVGTVALVSQAIGRKNHADANLAFNQALMLSLVCGFTVAILLLALVRVYMRSVTSDAATIEAGVQFIHWVLPGFALMLPMALLSCALRASGVVRAPVLAYVASVIINALLAPVLISGVVTGVPLGVQGAGLATSISVVVGVILLGARFRHLQPYMSMHLGVMRPRLEQWRRILHVGLPSSAEFVFVFVATATAYYALSSFGTSAQAGFGIGSRVLQVILVPALAIATAAGPIVGQNVGARDIKRVRDTTRSAVLIGAAFMGVVAVLLHQQAETIATLFPADPSAIAVATQFLHLMAWTVVPQCFVNTCLCVFQGLGNTIPALLTSSTRLATFIIPALWLTLQPAFELERVWHLSMASILLQAVAAGWLLRTELAKQTRALTPCVTSNPCEARKWRHAKPTLTAE